MADGYEDTVKPDQTTTYIRRPMLSPPERIPIQTLLYKTTTCLTRPATTFLVLQMKKKTCLKQPQENFSRRRNGKQCMKNKCLSDFIYSVATF